MNFIKCCAIVHLFRHFLRINFLPHISWLAFWKRIIPYLNKNKKKGKFSKIKNQAAKIYQTDVQKKYNILNTNL